MKVTFELEPGGIDRFHLRAVRDAVDGATSGAMA